MGADFDFTVLTEVDDAVREDILEGLPPAAVAEGVRDLDSDDAVRILEDLPSEEQADRPSKAAAARTSFLECPIIRSFNRPSAAPRRHPEHSGSW